MRETSIFDRINRIDVLDRIDRINKINVSDWIDRINKIRQDLQDNIFNEDLVAI